MANMHLTDPEREPLRAALQPSLQPAPQAAPREPLRVLVPLKNPSSAKSRLSTPLRAELAAAFAADVLAASTHGESEVATTVVPETGRGLNADLTEAHEALGRPRTAVIVGDLPCLTADVLAALVTSASAQSGRCFVPDAAGTGTTILFSPASTPLDPRFGPRSRAAHRQSGAVELDLHGVTGAERARRDVDTDVDLWDAMRIGVGPATAEVLQRGRS
jgi:2-phospho-L-lactate/phosphoenolpyruvate guanylyltransferase